MKKILQQFLTLPRSQSKNFFFFLNKIYKLPRQISTWRLRLEPNQDSRNTAFIELGIVQVVMQDEGEVMDIMP